MSHHAGVDPQVGQLRGHREHRQRQREQPVAGRAHPAGGQDQGGEFPNALELACAAGQNQAAAGEPVHACQFQTAADQLERFFHPRADNPV